MTQRRLTLALSDVDRGVYETLELTTAQHPSENDAFYVTRALGLALSWERGMAFSRGLCMPDEPAAWAHDDTGQLTRWVEVGKPKAERLERALRGCRVVDIYCHKPDEAYRQTLPGLKFPRGSSLTYVELDPRTVDRLAELTGSRASWSVTRSEGTVFVEVADGKGAGETLTFTLVPQVLG